MEPNNKVNSILQNASVSAVRMHNLTYLVRHAVYEVKLLVNVGVFAVCTVVPGTHSHLVIFLYLTLMCLAKDRSSMLSSTIEGYVTCVFINIIFLETGRCFHQHFASPQLCLDWNDTINFTFLSLIHQRLANVTSKLLLEGMNTCQGHRSFL